MISGIVVYGKCGTVLLLCNVLHIPDVVVETGAGAQETGKWKFTRGSFTWETAYFPLYAKFYN